MKISAILPLILGACTDKENDTGTSAQPVDNTEECEWDICYDECMTPEDESRTFSVSLDVFTGYLDSDNQLSEEKCEDLCRDLFADDFKYLYQVLECRHDGPDTESEEPAELLFCRALSTYYCEGRLHEGAGDARNCAGRDPVSAWLARAAHCEATSVASFLKLGQELARHGAPAELLKSCVSAAMDEVSHARRIGHLARQRGGLIAPLSFAPLSDRSLLDIATENAVEGCVKESFAALVALHQSRHCPDPEIRSAMAVIAADELRHAQLAWDIHAWLNQRLSAAEKCMVEAARGQAFEDLVGHWADREHRELDDQLGLPGPELGAQLSRAFQKAV